ncbi:phosphopantetheine-binding protein [Actinosynnema sp. NPDC002837]
MALDRDELLLDLWREVLGPATDPAVGFIEAGGDSFKAVLLATRVFEATGRDLDYLDVLQADGLDALRLLVTGAEPAGPRG